MRIRVRVEGMDRLKAAADEIKNGLASPRIISRLSNGLKERILDRTADGIDFDAEAFTPYVAQGKGSDVVTLRDTGAMLDSIKTSGQPETLLSFGSPEEMEKARRLQESGVGTLRTKRRFFALSKADRAWALKTLSEHARETIRKASVKGWEG